MDFIAMDGNLVYKMNLSVVEPSDSSLNHLLIKPYGRLISIDENRTVYYTDEHEHIYVRRITELTINSAFSVDNSGAEPVLYPSFRAGANMRITWQVPKAYHWFFVLCYNESRTDDYACHLIGYEEHDSLPYNRSWYIPPFPNIHDSTILCTGAMPDIYSRRMVSNFDIAFDKWMDNEWNGDLWHNSIDHFTPQLLRATSNHDVIPMPEEAPCFSTHCRLSSSPSFGEGLLDNIMEDFFE